MDADGISHSKMITSSANALQMAAKYAGKPVSDYGEQFIPNDQHRLSYDLPNALTPARYRTQYPYRARALSPSASSNWRQGRQKPQV